MLFEKSHLVSGFTKENKVKFMEKILEGYGYIKQYEHSKKFINTIANDLFSIGFKTKTTKEMIKYYFRKYGKEMPDEIKRLKNELNQTKE